MMMPSSLPLTVRTISVLLDAAQPRFAGAAEKVNAGQGSRVPKAIINEKADGEGFEPPVELPLRRFSKPVPSTRLSHPSEFFISRGIDKIIASNQLPATDPNNSNSDHLTKGHSKPTVPSKTAYHKLHLLNLTD